MPFCSSRGSFAAMPRGLARSPGGRFCLRAGRGRLGEVGRLVAAQEPMASCPAALKRIHLRMLWHQSKYTGRTAPGHGFWVLLPLGEGSVLFVERTSRLEVGILYFRARVRDESILGRGSGIPLPRIVACDL